MKMENVKGKMEDVGYLHFPSYIIHLTFPKNTYP